MPELVLYASYDKMCYFISVSYLGLFIFSWLVSSLSRVSAFYFLYFLLKQLLQALRIDSI